MSSDVSRVQVSVHLGVRYLHCICTLLEYYTFIDSVSNAKGRRIAHKSFSCMKMSTNVCSSNTGDSSPSGEYMLTDCPYGPGEVMVILLSD